MVASSISSSNGVEARAEMRWRRRASAEDGHGDMAAQKHRARGQGGAPGGEEEDGRVLGPRGLLTSPENGEKRRRQCGAPASKLGGLAALFGQGAEGKWGGWCGLFNGGVVSAEDVLGRVGRVGEVGDVVGSGGCGRLKTASP